MQINFCSTTKKHTKETKREKKEKTLGTGTCGLATQGAALAKKEGAAAASDEREQGQRR